MAIVKRIIEAHGGRVGVGETGARGAEIILTLPRQQGR
jgi:signal transduction histidine kinase